MQVGADTARKYGGTGLGLAICKQLVELMGGQLTVSSVEHKGSTFTFILPYKLSSISDSSDDPDELSDMDNQDVSDDEDIHEGIFLFPPRTLGSLFSSQSSGRIQKLSPISYGFDPSQNFNGLLEDSSSPSSSITCKEISSEEDVHSAAMDTSSEVSPSQSLCSANLSSAERNEQTRCSSSSGACNNPSEMSLPGVSQERCLTQAQRDGQSSECSSSKSAEIPNAELMPKILLVDDNKINVMVTKSMMKQLGHVIDVVNNGAEAVRTVQCKNYDLILMDVCMPVMDGLQATRLIRSYEETGSWDDAVKAGVELQLPLQHSSPNLQQELPRKRTPIIAMTANALSESADDCFANGMDSFVSKPVTFQNLKQCLQKYLP